MGVTVGAVAAMDIELAPLVRAFDRAPALIERNMLSAMKLVGTKAADRAKLVHDYTDRTGLLTMSIVAAQPEGKFLDSTLTIDIASGGDRVQYALYVEEGTKAHAITAKNKKALMFAGNSGDGEQLLPGGRVLARSVKHPGTRAYKFMANATEFIAEQVAPQIFEDALLDALDEALKG